MGPWGTWIFPSHWVFTLLNDHGDAIMKVMVMDLTSDRTREFSVLPDMEDFIRMHDRSFHMTDGHVT
eukprot:343024-Karenia_brevis.AAC.1